MERKKERKEEWRKDNGNDNDRTKTISMKKSSGTEWMNEGTNTVHYARYEYCLCISRKNALIFREYGLILMMIDTRTHNYRITIVVFAVTAPKPPPPPPALPSKMRSIKMDCTLIKSPRRIDVDDDDGGSDDSCRTTNANCATLVHSRAIIVSICFILLYRSGCRSKLARKCLYIILLYSNLWIHQWW